MPPQKDRKITATAPQPKEAWYNPTIFGKPLLPSSQRIGELAQSALSAITPAAGTPPPTMASVSVPPAGASLSQLRFTGPLLGTGPMFGLRGGQQPAAQPQPAQPATNYGLFAATQGLPSFDVIRTQTPSMTQGQITTAALTGQTQPLAFAAPTQAPITYTPEVQPTTRYSTPYGSFYATPQQEENMKRAYARQQEEAKRMETYRSTLARARAMRPEINRRSEEFFAQKREERAALQGATLAAAKAGVGSQAIRQARSSYFAQQPSTIRGIQSQYSQMNIKQPREQRVAQTMAPVYNTLGVGFPQSTPTTQTANSSFLPNFNPFSGISAIGMSPYS